MTQLLLDPGATIKRAIEPDDIAPMGRYGEQRKALRSRMIAYKKNRRMQLGPCCTLLFENFHTMLYQVYEMLYTEGNTPGQLEEELNAYNPLIPRGNALSVTMMLDIADPEQRQRLLSQLGGVEDTIFLRCCNWSIKADYEQEVERTTDEGKTSAVHFLHFRFSPEQAQNFFLNAANHATIKIEHPSYNHAAAIPPEVREAISKDL